MSASFDAHFLIHDLITSKRLCFQQLRKFTIEVC